LKTILIGYGDDRAQTAPVIVAGFETSGREQSAIFAAAKSGQKFPQGILRLELCTVESCDIAIAINQPTPKTKKKNKYEEIS
jgi:hypothetical protein